MTEEAASEKHAVWAMSALAGVGMLTMGAVAIAETTVIEPRQGRLCSVDGHFWFTVRDDNMCHLEDAPRWGTTTNSSNTSTVRPGPYQSGETINITRTCKDGRELVMRFTGVYACAREDFEQPE